MPVYKTLIYDPLFSKSMEQKEKAIEKRLQSPSSINTYKQCPRKYYYQYIRKLKTLPSIHLVRGNIAHSVLETFYDLDITSDQEYATFFKTSIQRLLLFQWNQYKDKLKELNLTEDQEKFYFEETMMMLMNWVNHFIEELKLEIRKGNSLLEAFHKLTPIREERYVSDKYYVQGFIDAIHHVEDEVHILDYKTNASSEFKDSIKLQLAIYSLLYLEKHGEAPSKVGIFFLRHKRKYIDVDEELIELAKKEIEMVHANTCSANIEDYPCNCSPLCKWSSGQCDFYDICKPHSN